MGSDKSLYGGIEAGGTKFVCCIGSGPEDIRAETRFPTTTPEETLGRTVEFFREHRAEHLLTGIGVACFGPVDLDKSSPTYGHVTTTPKPGWAGTDVVGMLQRELGLPVAFDTDVNGAALGEMRWGAGAGLDPFVYMTIGTGVGGGAIVNSAPVHGLVHPEIGHIRVPHDRERDPFEGICPFHGDCLEGLASGPAIGKRWGVPAETLPAGHPAWELEASYLGELVATLVCTLSPRRIVLGGGVMSAPGLFPLVRQEAVRLLAGYVSSPAILEHIDDYVVPPGLGDRSGRLGAIALAKTAGVTSTA